MECRERKSKCRHYAVDLRLCNVASWEGLEKGGEILSSKSPHQRRDAYDASRRGRFRKSKAYRMPRERPEFLTESLNAPPQHDGGPPVDVRLMLMSASRIPNPFGVAMTS